MSGGRDHCSQHLPASRIAAGLGGAQLLELPIAIGWAECPVVALLDSGATHCFFSERVAQLANLHLDISARLDVRLADREQRACFGVARKVRVTFAPGVVQCWDFWIVPLAMDLILGLPWLQ